MNIHPIIVHFPIALLSFYSLLEFVRYKRMTSQKGWFFLKAFFVVMGTLGAYVALFSGEPAEHLYVQANPSMRDIVEVHSLWAGVTASIYSLISLIYLVQVLRRKGYEHVIKNISKVGILWMLVTRVTDLLNNKTILTILALCGLGAVIVTGSLGGFLVYGIEGAKTDPFIYFAYKMFY